MGIWPRFLLEALYGSTNAGSNLSLNKQSDKLRDLVCLSSSRYRQSVSPDNCNDGKLLSRLDGSNEHENFMNSVSQGPLISVCIPAFNRPEFMSDLLDTIISQSFRDFEVVVSEDNSPKSAEIQQIVESYSARNPELLISFPGTKKHWATTVIFARVSTKVVVATACSWVTTTF